MAKSIQEITEIINEFRMSRGWSNDNPTVLITALLAELGELVDHYQWKTKFEKFDKDKKTEVSFEFVDVIIYLFTLASNSGIDIEKAFDEKLPKLVKKFPIGGNHKKAHEDYRKTGKNKLYK